MRTIQITKLVRVTEEVSLDDIKPFLVYAELSQSSVTDEYYICVYYSTHRTRNPKFLQKAFWIPCPEELVSSLSDKNKILNYARENIPESFTHLYLNLAD